MLPAGAMLPACRPARQAADLGLPSLLQRVDDGHRVLGGQVLVVGVREPLDPLGVVCRGGRGGEEREGGKKRMWWNRAQGGLGQGLAAWQREPRATRRRPGQATEPPPVALWHPVDRALKAFLSAPPHSRAAGGGGAPAMVIIGALAQAPMHSISPSVNIPSCGAAEQHAGSGARSAAACAALGRVSRAEAVPQLHPSLPALTRPAATATGGRTIHLLLRAAAPRSSARSRCPARRAARWRCPWRPAACTASCRTPSRGTCRPCCG